MHSPLSMQALAHLRATSGPSPRRTMSRTPATTACGSPAPTPAGAVIGQAEKHAPHLVQASSISSTRLVKAASNPELSIGFFLAGMADVRIAQNRTDLSICIFRIHRINRPAPRTVELPQQFLGRRLAALGQVLERLEIACLVGAIGVEPLAPSKPDASERQRFARNRQQIAAADRGAEAQSWHLVAQLLALFGAPALGEIPRGVEAGVVIEQTNPECRPRRQPSPRAGVGATHFEVALEPHLGEHRR